MRLWPWIQNERLWRRRRPALGDFRPNRPPRWHGTEPTLGLGAPCDFAPGGIVWRCEPGGQHYFELTIRRDLAKECLEADLAETSAEVPCTGLASGLFGFSIPETKILACGIHERWLRRHDLLNGMDSGLIARFTAAGIRFGGTVTLDDTPNAVRAELTGEPTCRWDCTRSATASAKVWACHPAHVSSVAMQL
jgi:hypothetical protein